MTDIDDEGTPRWVKGFGIVFIVLLVLFIVRHVLTGGMRH